MTRWLAAVTLVTLCGCVDLSKPRPYQCDPDGTSLDEAARQARCLSTSSERWYCAGDGYCASATVASTRACRADAQCPDEHRCGTTAESSTAFACRAAALEGAFRCRADAGDSDCGPTWRCGLEGACHARVGAPVRCGGDRDCDDGWRCGRAGRCVDPRGEQLFTPAALGPPVPLNPLVDFFMDGGGRFLVSPGVMLDGGVSLRVLLRGSQAMGVVGGPGGLLTVPLAPFDERAGWLSTLTTSSLIEARGDALVVTTLLEADAGAEVFPTQLEGEASSLVSLTLEGREVVAVVLDGGANASTVDVFSGASSSRLIVDAGVIGVTSFGTAEACPQMVLATSEGLAAWVPDGGFFTGAPVSVVPFAALPRVSLTQLVGATVPAARLTLRRVVPGASSLAVLFDARPFGTPAAREVTTWVAAVPLRACRFPARANLVGLACPGLERAEVTMARPTSLPDGGATVTTVCVQGEQQVSSELGAGRVTLGERGLVAQAGDSVALINSSGALAIDLEGVVRPVTLADPVEGVSESSLRGRLFLGGGGLFAAGRLGLEPVARPEDPSFLIVADVRYGAATVVLRNGLAVDEYTDGGSTFLAVMPDELEVSWAQVFRGDVLVEVARDALWTAVLAPPTLAVLSPRARPALGFPITSIALTEHADGGAFEGALIAADRLFSVDAVSPTRVNTVEVPLSVDDPRHVYFESVGAEHRGRVVLASGQVLSWPRLVPLTEPLSGSLEVVAQCGATLHLTDEGLFRLEVPDGGLGRWVDVGGPVGQRAKRRAGRLLPMDGGVLVSLEGGGTWVYPVACPR